MTNRRVLALAAGLLASCTSTVLPAQPVVAPAAASAGVLLPDQTPVELMVTKEVTSRTAKPGERFKLRVNRPIVVDGVVIAPIGTTAWGEILGSNGTGIAGGKGRLSARLLYIEAPVGRISLTGTQGHEGGGNTAGVMLGVLSFGILGLLSKGTDAQFKAGDLLTGYVDGDHRSTAQGVLMAPAASG